MSIEIIKRKSKLQNKLNVIRLGNLPILKLFSSWIFIFILIIFSSIFINQLLKPKAINSVLLLTSLMAIASMAQSFVVLVGGVDLSIPMIAAYAGVFLTWFTEGNNGPLIWVLPVVVLTGCLIGALNGLGVVLLKVHPIVMTIGMSAILEGIIMLLTKGTPRGEAPDLILFFSTGKIGGIFISIFLVLGIYIFVSIVMSYTAYGRKIFAVGNNRTAARLSGIKARFIEISAYILSGFFAAILGILLTGFVGQSYIKMGEEYLLASLAAVAIGGAKMSGGKGHPIGTFGGSLMLSFLSVILITFLIPDGIRNIIFGLIILIGIIGIRENIKNS